GTMRVEHRPMQSPFFGFHFDIGSKIPTSHAEQARGRNPSSIQILRYAGDPMVRSSLPEPVGGRFSVVAKALLALAKCFLGQLEVLNVGSRPVPFNNVACVIAQRFGAE